MIIIIITTARPRPACTRTDACRRRTCCTSSAWRRRTPPSRPGETTKVGIVKSYYFVKHVCSSFPIRTDSLYPHSLYPLCVF